MHTIFGFTISGLAILFKTCATSKSKKRKIANNDDTYNNLFWQELVLLSIMHKILIKAHDGVQITA